MNVPATKIGDVLPRCEAVVKAMTIGEPGNQLGETTYAFVIAIYVNIEPDDVRSFREEINIPERFWTRSLALAESFPMRPSGKA